MKLQSRITRYSSFILVLLCLIYGCSHKDITKPIVIDHSSAANNINIHALVQDSQKVFQSDKKIILTWWMPEEFWNATFSQKPHISKIKTEKILKALESYTIIAVLEAEIDRYGNVKYKTENQISDNIKLVINKKKPCYPLHKNDITSETKAILLTIKPFFVQMLGATGYNMHFIIFPKKNDKFGKKRICARGKGEFTAIIGKNSFRWKLPLNSVCLPQICSKCREKCSGSWIYCPWCKAKLLK